MGLEASLTKAEWRAALDHFGSCCAYCGLHDGRGETCRPRVVLSFVVPLGRGGASCARNVLPACRPCIRRRPELTAEAIAWIGEPMEEHEVREVHRWAWFRARCGAEGVYLSMNDFAITCEDCK
jgi:hypothetical protein